MWNKSEKINIRAYIYKLSKEADYFKKRQSQNNAMLCFVNNKTKFNKLMTFETVIEHTTIRTCTPWWST